MTTLTLTDEAVERLRSVLETQSVPEGALRVFVSPGGCSGFSYGMSLEPEPADDDEVVEQSGVKVVVDPFSLQYLSGAQIDFIDSLMGGGFTVVNPNAVKSCARGQRLDTGFGAGAAKRAHEQGCVSPGEKARRLSTASKNSLSDSSTERSPLEEYQLPGETWARLNLYRA